MYPAELDEGLADEDEGDEEGEDLLGEAGDEADQEASLEGHCDDHDDDEPEADPDAARQVLHVVCFAELWGHKAKEFFSGLISIKAVKTFFMNAMLKLFWLFHKRFQNFFICLMVVVGLGCKKVTSRWTKSCEVVSWYWQATIKQIWGWVNPEFKQ